VIRLYGELFDPDARGLSVVTNSPALARRNSLLQ